MFFAITAAFAADPTAAAAPPAEPTEEAATDAAPAAPTTYALDPNGWLAVLVRYDRSALGGGHDHVVAASTFDGSVVWNPEDVSACDISISFPVSALAVDPPGSRDRVGFEGTTSEGDKGKIKDNLSGKNQLQASMFPSIAFQSKSCAAAGDKVRVTGDLTLHGVSHTVSTDMSITADGEKFSAKGKFTAMHSDWGMDPFSALFGALRNDPALEFRIDVAGTPK